MSETGGFGLPGSRSMNGKEIAADLRFEVRNLGSGEERRIKLYYASLRRPGTRSKASSLLTSGTP